MRKRNVLHVHGAAGLPAAIRSDAEAACGSGETAHTPPRRRGARRGIERSPPAKSAARAEFSFISVHADDGDADGDGARIDPGRPAEIKGAERFRGCARERDRRFAVFDHGDVGLEHRLVRARVGHRDERFHRLAANPIVPVGRVAGGRLGVQHDFDQGVLQLAPLVVSVAAFDLLLLQCRSERRRFTTSIESRQRINAGKRVFLAGFSGLNSRWQVREASSRGVVAGQRMIVVQRDLRHRVDLSAY